MTLSNEQKQQVAEWVSQGMELKELQVRIREDFDISLTYMDVRFLVDDLDLSLQDKPEPAQPKQEAKAEDPISELVPENEAGGAISVEVDSISVPNAIISGTVRFSDGETAKWLIDNMGRPGLIPDKEGYRPSQEDIQEFQKELTGILQKQGFA